MSQLPTIRLGLLLLGSLAGFASAASQPGNHVHASLTRTSSAQKTKPSGPSSLAYVVAGSGLMSLGLLFGHIRQRPATRIQSKKDQA